MGAVGLLDMQVRSGMPQTQRRPVLKGPSKAATRPGGPRPTSNRQFAADGVDIQRQQRGRPARPGRAEDPVMVEAMYKMYITKEACVTAHSH